MGKDWFIFWSILASPILCGRWITVSLRLRSFLPRPRCWLFCPHSLFGFLHARTCRKTGKDIHKGELSEVINPKSIWVSYRGVRSHVQAVHQSPARPERKQQSGERVGKQAIVAFIMFSTLFFGPDNQDTMFDGQRIVASSKSKRGFTSSPVQITEKLRKTASIWCFLRPVRPAQVPRWKDATQEERSDTGHPGFPESPLRKNRLSIKKQTILSSTCRIIFP